MDKKYIVLKKLNITERGAMYILSDHALCNRIVNEDVIELKNASKKYEIPQQTLKKYIKGNLITSIKNGVELKGRKQYVFENELIDCHNLFLKSGRGYLKYINEFKNVVRDFAEKILSDSEYDVFKSIHNGISYKDKAIELEVSEQNISLIYLKCMHKLKSFTNKLNSFDKLTDSINAKKTELIRLNKSIKQSQNYIEKTGLSELVKTVDVYKIKIDHLELSYRSKRLLNHVKIYNVEDFIDYINKNGIDFLLKHRSIGAGTYKDIKDTFTNLFEKHNLNLKL